MIIVTTIIIMRIEYDEVKNKRNINERHLPFARVVDFDFASAIIIQDIRYEYPEPRFVATGYLRERLHVYL